MYAYIKTLHYYMAYYSSVAPLPHRKAVQKSFRKPSIQLKMCKLRVIFLNKTARMSVKMHKWILFFCAIE